MMEEKLPKGWRILSLSEIVEILDNKRVPVSSSERAKRIGNIPYYGATGQAGWIDDFIFDEELVLLGEDGAPFFDKKKNVAYLINGKSWVNNHAHVLKAFQNKSNNKFIFYFLNHFDYTGYVGGTTRLKLTQANLKNIPVPTPPLPEQQRIVAKLDTLFGHLDRVREKLDGIPALLKNFRQQVLTQAVTGELTREWREGKGLGEWEYVDLQKVADVVDPHPSHRTPPPVIGGIPYISIKDVDSKGGIDFKNSTLVSPNVLEEHIKRYELKDGDLGFGKIGTLGKPFRLPIFKERTYTLSANIILIQPKSNCNPKFLFYYLDSPIINKLLKEGAKATSQPAFGIKKARVFPTPNPSQEEQKEIVKRVDALFELADKIESQYQSLKAKIDQLPQAILAKAFRGELVEQEVKGYELEEREGLMAAEGQLSYRVKTKT